MSKDDLPFVKRVPIPKVGDEDIPHERLSDLTVPAREHDVTYYAVPKDSWIDRLFSGFIDKIRKKKAIAKVLGGVEEVITYFLPRVAGDAIDGATDIMYQYLFEIDDSTSVSLTTNKNNNNMNWIIDRLHEESTWKGIIVVLTAVGLAISPALATAIIFTGVAIVGTIDVFTKSEFRKTLRGAVMILTAAGVAISPELKEFIITTGVGMVGLIESFFKEKK